MEGTLKKYKNFYSGYRSVHLRIQATDLLLSKNQQSTASKQTLSLLDSVVEEHGPLEFSLTRNGQKV